MIAEVYIGKNGQGKTCLLRDYIKKCKKKSRLITNVEIIADIYTRKLDENRVGIILDMYNASKLFDGYGVSVKSGRITTDSSTPVFSSEYLDMITLLCKSGDELVLDEPDMGMDLPETCKIQDALILLIPTYKTVKLAFHSQLLLGMENFLDVQYYWVQDYKEIKLTGEQVYGSIGTLWG